MFEESSSVKANRENRNATSKEYQAFHHAELEGDVLWGPSMPPERELKILGESVAGKAVLEIACGAGSPRSTSHRWGPASPPLTSLRRNSITPAPSRGRRKPPCASSRWTPKTYPCWTTLASTSHSPPTRSASSRTSKARFGKSRGFSGRAACSRSLGCRRSMRSPKNAGCLSSGVTDIVEPEPLPQESTYSDVFRCPRSG